MKYVGETSKSLGERFSQHRGYVNTYQNKTDAGKRTEATGDHFNLPSHSISDMRLQIVEKVFDKSKAVRLQREKLYINFFESDHRGINRKK